MVPSRPHSGYSVLSAHSADPAVRAHSAVPVLLVVVLLVSGVGHLVAGVAAAPSTDPVPARSHEQESAPPDPATDTIGWENGYWHNESIDVSQTDGDGLTAAEQRRLMARTMARVEFIRDREFDADVELTFVSRERFRQGFLAADLPADVDSDLLYDSFTLENGFWEATFLFGEDTDATQRIRRFGAEAILGYSAEEGMGNEVVIVTRTTDAPAVHPEVLAHEVLHALQGQHYDIAGPQYQAGSHDARLGKDGLLEGSASYVDSVYSSRCGDDWECLDTPRNWAGRGRLDTVAYPYVVSQPYADGTTLVYGLLEGGSWGAVDALHGDIPQSSEQVIHRDPGEPVADLEAPDASGDAWSLVATERVGEATMFVMFWRQAVFQDPDTIDRRAFREGRSEWNRLHYESEPTVGWGADELLLYRDGDRRGYVWYTAWDTPADAREFVGAYRTLLASYGAESRGEHTWVIPENRSFADAFHVVRDGARVRIVNAPTVEALGELHADAQPGAAPTPTTATATEPPTSPDPEPTPRSTDGTGTPATGTPATRTTPTTDAGGNGFGLAVAIGTLLAAVALLASHRRGRNR